MTSQPDYYAALRVTPAASQHEISRAYRELMRAHHPDLAHHPDRDGGAGGGGDRNRAALLQIMQAFSVLGNPARRAAYDRSRTGTGAGTGTSAPGAGPIVIPVRTVRRRGAPSGNTIRITPVRWESGPWA